MYFSFTTFTHPIHTAARQGDIVDSTAGDKTIHVSAGQGNAQYYTVLLNVNILPQSHIQ